MRVLADTNVFICFTRRLPVDPQIERALSDPDAERCLSPVSIIELYRKWQSGDVPDNPDTWLEKALPAWTILPVTVPIARQSVLWSWPHKDPADRLLAATAVVDQIELWHTDTRLKKFTGFPQRYFVNRLKKTRAY